MLGKTRKFWLIVFSPFLHNVFLNSLVQDSVAKGPERIVNAYYNKNDEECVRNVNLFFPYIRHYQKIKACPFPSMFLHSNLDQMTLDFYTPVKDGKYGGISHGRQAGRQSLVLCPEYDFVIPCPSYLKLGMCVCNNRVLCTRNESQPHAVFELFPFICHFLLHFWHNFVISCLIDLKLGMEVCCNDTECSA